MTTTPSPFSPLPPGAIVSPTTPHTADGQPDLEADPVPYLVKRTLAELGDVLPHGRLEDYPGRTAFRFMPPVLGVRRRQGQVKANTKLQRSPARMLAAYLGAALDTLGTDSCRAWTDDQAIERLGKLPVGDVLYLSMRWQALCYPDGAPLGDRQCGACGAPFGNVKVDLGTLEIDCLPDEARELRPVARVCLLHGFELGSPDKRRAVAQVLVRPPSFGDVFYGLAPESMRNDELVGERLLRGAILGSDALGPDRGLPDGALDDLWPQDQRLIGRALELITPSPDLEIEIACPVDRCRATNSEVIDWTAVGFSSGRPGGR